MSTLKEREHEAKRLYKKQYDDLSLKQKEKVLDTIQRKPVGYLNKKKKPGLYGGFKIPAFRY